MSVGAGLLTTLTPDSGEGEWVGYQLILGIGVGAGFQQAILAAQTVLTRRDIPIGIATMMFLQLLGGSVFVSVAENVLDNNLIINLAATLPDLDPQIIIHSGATQLRNLVRSEEIVALLQAYNSALMQAFMVALIMACLSIFGSALTECRSVKKKGDSSSQKASQANRAEEVSKV